MKTTIKSHYFDCRNHAEKAQYNELSAALKSTNGKCFCTWGGGSHYNSKFQNGMAVTLETGTLFDNQWNTAPIDGISDKGLRVFDWAEDHPIDFSKSIKRGHYLIITDEMKEARRNTMKCGYCGKQEPAAKGYTFCPHCIGSQYLTPELLNLTRMRPVCDDSKTWPELSDAEWAYLMPLYKDAQLYGKTEADKKRIASQRENLATEHARAINKANVKFEGFT